MPPFTDEATVRLHFQLHDTTLAPNDLFTRAITLAHARLLQRLDPAVDTGSPPDDLLPAETLLAGARVLESLALRSATLQPVIVVGGQRLDRGQEFATLLAAADRAERHAWDIAAPYLKPEPSETLATITPTQEVLGESS